MLSLQPQLIARVGRCNISANFTAAASFYIPVLVQSEFVLVSRARQAHPVLEVILQMRYVDQQRLTLKLITPSSIYLMYHKSRRLLVINLVLFALNILCPGVIAAFFLSKNQCGSTP